VTKPLAEFETTQKHLRHKTFVIRVIRKEEKFLVWGYNIIDEEKYFFGDFLEINLSNAEIKGISLDPEDESAFWIFLGHNHKVDNFLSNKNIIKIERP
jgi:hypothetical protein